MEQEIPSLISSAKLAEWLKRPEMADRLRILDGSWYLSNEGRNAREEYAAGHLPNAQFFDLDLASEQQTSLPHMLPSEDAFADYVSSLGIGNQHHVVVYDGAGLFSAARVWWMFRAFGHKAVSVLDGGLPKWRCEHKSLTKEISSFPPASFVARYQPNYVCALSDVINFSGAILDARSPLRFLGKEPEPRPGVRSGHIPGAINLHYKALLREDGTLFPNQELRNILVTHHVPVDVPLLASCGSGVTACILALAFDQLGVYVPVYDGSWAEWGSNPDLPVETSENFA